MEYGIKDEEEWTSEGELKEKVDKTERRLR